MDRRDYLIIGLSLIVLLLAGAFFVQNLALNKTVESYVRAYNDYVFGLARPSYLNISGGFNGTNSG